MHDIKHTYHWRQGCKVSLSKNRYKLLKVFQREFPSQIMVASAMVPPSNGAVLFLGFVCPGSSSFFVLFDSCSFRRYPCRDTVVPVPIKQRKSMIFKVLSWWYHAIEHQSIYSNTMAHIITLNQAVKRPRITTPDTHELQNPKPRALFTFHPGAI